MVSYNHSPDLTPDILYIPIIHLSINAHSHSVGFGFGHFRFGNMNVTAAIVLLFVFQLFHYGMYIKHLGYT